MAQALEVQAKKAVAKIPTNAFIDKFSIGKIDVNYFGVMATWFWK